MALLRKLGDEITESESSVDQRSPDDAFNRLVEALYGVRVRIVLLQSFLKVFNKLINNLGPLGVLVVGGLVVIEGRTELGTIVAFMSGFDKLRSPTRELLNFYRLVSRIKVQFRLFREAVT